MGTKNTPKDIIAKLSSAGAGRIGGQQRRSEAQQAGQQVAARDLQIRGFAAFQKSEAEVAAVVEQPILKVE